MTTDPFDNQHAVEARLIISSTDSSRLLSTLAGTPLSWPTATGCRGVHRGGQLDLAGHKDVVDAVT